MPSLEREIEKEVEKFQAIYGSVPRKQTVFVGEKEDGSDVIGHLVLAFGRISDIARAEERETRDKLYLEVNIPALIKKMKVDAEEYGQYHDDECPVNSEDGADIGYVCDCEKINALRTFAEEWMGKVNEWWVAHAKEHRKLCTPEGNKMLTRMMGGKNRSQVTPPTTPEVTENNLLSPPKPSSIPTPPLVKQSSFWYSCKK